MRTFIAIFALVLLSIGTLGAARGNTLAERVWQRYTRAPSVQISVVSRFTALSLEAKPSVYENIDPEQWRQVELEIERLAKQSIQLELAVQRPNRLYMQERSAFGTFRTVSDGKTWRFERSNGVKLQTRAPATLQQMASERYRAYLGLDNSEDVDVLRLLVLGEPRLKQKLLRAKEQKTDNPLLRQLVWQEPIHYQGMKGQGTVTCWVDTRSALVQRVEYRFVLGWATEAWLNMAIIQQCDNSRFSKPPAAALFHVGKGSGVTRR